MMEKTVTEFIRENFLKGCNIVPLVLDIKELKQTEWSPEFEALMRNRLVIGAYRYGKLNSKGKKKYDRIESALKRLSAYKDSGNQEHLVDVANLCLLEFEEGDHINKHFHAVDDGEHVKEK